MVAPDLVPAGGHNGAVTVGGMLLTGGRSRRMGTDKAALRLRGPDGVILEPLAIRTARLLETVASPTVEVGPGYTHLTMISDSGTGPLAAVTAGAEGLAGLGWQGPALVVATDLPHLTASVLAWLADHPATGSVVPLVGGRAQPLCARLSAADLRVAARIVAAGRRAMHDLLDVIDATLVDPVEEAGALADIDEPDDVPRLGWGPVNP